MLHILWLALKFIGILLAAALALLLLAVALVLFCPLAYRVKVQKDAQWQVWGKASWLFGLVSVTVCKEPSGMQKAIRICGVRVSSWKKLFRRKRRPRKKAASAEDAPEKKEFRENAKAAEASGKEKESFSSEEPVGKETSGISPEESAHKETLPKETKKEPSASQAVDAPPRENLLRRLWTRIAEKCRGIRDAFLGFINAVRSACKKISLWKTFLGDTRTGAAMQLTWAQAIRLLRHAGPQKCKGHVNLGFDDPAATGQALAALGAAYPLHRGRIAVNPVWDRAVLEGEVFVKGRVFGIILLHMAGILYFDKDVKYAVNWFRGQES